MIFKYFLLNNLVSLYMKIINSVVMIGLYFGFLNSFSISPSYLFLLRSQILEEGYEGIEKKVSATTGFISGQLMMFLSIYYAPMHLALGKPYTVTFLTLPYLLFHFFWNNHKHFLNYEFTTRNSMRNLSTQCIFMTNFFSQLFNYFILPSSILSRLVNIYMFRCNNKIIVVTSSFVGWLIGHFFFMKWVGLVLFWTRQNNSIRWNIPSNRNSINRIFSILLFLTCVYYLGRIPSPILTKKLKETSEREEREGKKEEKNVKQKRTQEIKNIKEEQKGFIKEDPYLFPPKKRKERENADKIDRTKVEKINVNENKKDLKLEIFKDQENESLLFFEKPLITLLFDYKRWNRPLRYIKNDRFANAVRNEMSQYFFYICQSDGKQKMSFMYPPSLSTFLEMIQKKKSLLTIEQFSSHSHELNGYWIYTNKQKKNKQSSEFINRIESLSKKSYFPDILEKRIRLCNDKKEYLPKKNDPFLNGPYRGTIKKMFPSSIINETLLQKSIDKIFLNKIHSVFLTDYPKLEQKKNNTFFKKILSTDIGHFLILINKFVEESTPCFNFYFKRLSLFPSIDKKRIDSEDRAKSFKFLSNGILTDSKNKIPKKSIGVKEISKKVPRWSYKLINELEQQARENEENVVAEDHEIRSRKTKHVIIFADKQQSNDSSTNIKKPNNLDQTDKISLIRYSQQSDFRRDLIKGSMRTQRRKTVIVELFQANVHSPLFLGRMSKLSFFSFKISGLIKRIFRNWMGKKTEFKISYYPKEKKRGKKEKYKIEEKTRIEIAETWDVLPLAQAIRGSMLVTQSILRKNILLPVLIIAKNIGRMVLFQLPEWTEDLKKWNRERHVKCTYNGVQLSETEFPKNWLTEGIQIKILFPFRLKPWHRFKLRSSYGDQMKKQNNDFSFLTVWGMEAKLPFGSPRKLPSFFEPIFKELKKRIRKLKNKHFIVIVLKILKERTKYFLRVSKETKKLAIKNIFFLKRIINSKFSKGNSILLFELGKVYESSETKKKKDSIVINQMVHELPIQNRSMYLKKDSMTDQKMKGLIDRTNAIRNQIEKINKEKKKRFLVPKIKIHLTKSGYNAKRLKSLKNIWQILKRRNARLIFKSHFFIKLFIEKMYLDTLLCIINISSRNSEFIFESTKKIIVNVFINNETNQDRIDKTNQTTINFISTIKESFSIYNRNKTLQPLSDLSSLSQAYVFYKLSQIQVINLDLLKYALQYHGTSFFLKNEIKDYFGTQEISHSDSKLSRKKLQNFELNQWKNWLMGYYQYDLSPTIWSRLVPQKWRNRINQPCTIQKEYPFYFNFKKWDLYEKVQLIHYKKKMEYEENQFLNQKDHFRKTYAYDLFSYKSSNYEDKKDSYICGTLFKIKKKEGIYYSKEKTKSFDMIRSTPINNNYLVENYTPDMEKNWNRKYFDWRIIHFCLRKRVNIEAWIHIDTGTNSNNNTKIWANTNNSKISNEISKKGLFFFTIYQDPSNNQKEFFFDWMGMNEEILNWPIANMRRWFFRELVFFYSVYKIKSSILPIKLLLLNYNENVRENKNINIKKKKKKDLCSSSNEKKSSEFENPNQEEKEHTEQGDLGFDAQNQENLESLFSNQQKDVEESYVKFTTKKHVKKKQYKSNIEAELYFCLKRYSLFQLRRDDPLNQRMINNIKAYCLLLKLRNPREIALSSIQRGEISLDIMLIQKDVTLAELIKKGILIIEPVRMYIKNDIKSLLYQTISISLFQKSKYQTNQRYQEKRYVGKKDVDKVIVIRNQKITRNRDKNHSDLPALENLFSNKRRREFRIRNSFNSKNRKNVDKNRIFSNRNNVKNSGSFLYENKEKKKLIKLKFLLWPHYRLEDLACMNRYWFDINNGSRFSMLRIYMYQRLQIR